MNKENKTPLVLLRLRLLNDKNRFDYDLGLRSGRGATGLRTFTRNQPYSLLPSEYFLWITLIIRKTVEEKDKWIETSGGIKLGHSKNTTRGQYDMAV